MFAKAVEPARLLGVSLRTIRNWDREGLPSQTWGMRVRRYQPSVAASWAAERSTVRSPDHPARRLVSARATHTER
jgi:phage terminase Nu1 subunit (DNA packaging protein)